MSMFYFLLHYLEVIINPYETFGGYQLGWEFILQYMWLGGKFVAFNIRYADRNNWATEIKCHIAR